MFDRRKEKMRVVFKHLFRVIDALCDVPKVVLFSGDEEGDQFAGIGCDFSESLMKAQYPTKA